MVRMRGRPLRLWSQTERSLEPAATLEDRLPVVVIAAIATLFVVQVLLAG